MRTRNIGFRLRHLFFPALLLALTFIVSYLAAEWLLVEWAGLAPLDDDLVTFWLPLALGVLLTSIIFGPWLRLLTLKKVRADLPFLYGGVVAVMMIVPTMMLSLSVREASWGLIEIASADEIPATARDRYYAPTSVCWQPESVRIYRMGRREGRSSTLNLYFYAAVPLCQRRFANTNVWIGLKYRKALSNGISEREIEAAAEDFDRASKEALRQEQPSNWRYVERLRPGEDRREFAKAISGRADGARDVVIVTPYTEAFGLRTIARLQWAAEVFGGAALLWLVLLMIPKLNPAESASVRNTGKLRPEKDGDLIWKIMLPSRKFYGAQLLFWLNVVVYLAMVFAGLGVTSFATDDLLNWGANHGPLYFGLENYGLVTSLFVHAGLMHLFNNMYGLVFAFFFLLPVAHNGRLILCYLACGVSGSVASLWWNPHVISVGASGAVLGLWGILVILAALRDRRILGAEKMILINFAIFGGLTALLGLAKSGIDNAAHVGGFASGLMLGVILWGIEKRWPDPEFKLRRHRKKRVAPTSEAPIETPVP